MVLTLKDLSNLLTYLRLLDKLNKELFHMHGVRTLENDAFFKYTGLTDEFSDTFFKITGYTFDRQSNNMTLCNSNGILSLNEMLNLYNSSGDLENILVNNMQTINTLRLYRNKSQHNPHKVDFKSISGSEDDFSIKFKYSGIEYSLRSNKLDKLTKDINQLMSKILVEVDKDLSIETKLLLNSKNKL